MTPTGNPCAKISYFGMNAASPDLTKKNEKTQKMGTLRGKHGQRVSRICFTLNNWTEEEYEQVCDTCNNQFKYAVVGKEIGPENGVPHLQGCAVLGKQLALVSIKKFPGFARAHIEPMYGTVEKASNYCMEDGDFIVFGEPPQPGKRNDIEQAVEAIREGKTMRDLVEGGNGPVVVKYHKGLSFVRSITRPKRTEPPVIIWIHGQTGVGKTRFCVDFADREKSGDYWLSDGSLQWFDGYDGQHVAILDELRIDSCKPAYMLRLLDRYTLRVPVKGGFVDWTPHFIFITAPMHPEIMYQGVSNDTAFIDQLLRRISYIMELGDSSGVPPSPEEYETIYSTVKEYLARHTPGDGQFEVETVTRTIGLFGGNGRAIGGSVGTVLGPTQPYESSVEEVEEEDDGLCDKRDEEMMRASMLLKRNKPKGPKVVVNLLDDSSSSAMDPPDYHVSCSCEEEFFDHTHVVECTPVPSRLENVFTTQTETRVQPTSDDYEPDYQEVSGNQKVNWQHRTPRREFLARDREEEQRNKKPFKYVKGKKVYYTKKK